MKSSINTGIIKSKSSMVSAVLFLALITQLSVILAGGSHMISPFGYLPTIHTAYAQVDEAFKKYENEKFGLTLSYPPTWSVEEIRKDPSAPANNSIVAIFASPAQDENDKYLENVIINVQGPRSDIVSLEKYTQNSINAFNNMSDNIKIIKSDTETLAELPAHQLEYTTGLPGLNLTKLQIFTVVNNNTAYVVTYGAEESEYQKNLDNVEKLISSIKIDSEALEKVEEDGSQPTKTGGNSHNVLVGEKTIRII